MVDQKLRVKTGLSMPLMGANQPSVRKKEKPAKAPNNQPLSEDTVNLESPGQAQDPSAASSEQSELQASPKDENIAEQLLQQKKEADRRLANQQAQQQKEKLRLIKECEGILLVNYDWLDMPDYPSNESLAEARRVLEYTILINVLLLVGCVAALNNWVPAWVGGSALGLLFLSICVTYTPFRKYLGIDETYRGVIKERKKCEFKAIGHIKLLEGSQGLVWKAARLAPYNSALSKPVFKTLITFSRANRMLSLIKTRAHIRLYLLYMLEAEKAYSRLKEDYFSTHRKLQKMGIDDTR